MKQNDENFRNSIYSTYIQTANEENITATNMTINPTDCNEPCNATVTVTWKNNGGSEEFKPAIKVNGIKKELEQITLKKKPDYYNFI